jgi:hypothetical protein
MNMRDLITLIESPDIVSKFRANARKLLPKLMSVFDSRTAETTMEEDFDDEDAAAQAWFDVCMGTMSALLRKPKITVYRHMQVEDFKEFVTAIENGSAGLGKHWSVMHSIESPTWAQNHVGDISIRLQAEVDPSVVDWDATLLQWFEWPAEFELIFEGGVAALRIENEDTGKIYTGKAPAYPREV